MSSMDNRFVRIADMVHDSIVDGPGLRYVVFAQGCVHACPGCHNPRTHALDGGVLISVDELWRNMRSNPLTMGLTISGGEPFLQPGPLAELARRAHGAGMDVWVYTGYYYEELLGMDRCVPLLGNADVLVDGPFVPRLRSFGLEWRGSSNQRLIDVRRSLESGRVRLYDLREDLFGALESRLLTRPGNSDIVNTQIN